MLLILSPAKTMREYFPGRFPEKTLPQYLDKAALLVKELKELSVSELSRLMKISPALAEQTFGRFQQWEEKRHDKEGVPALLSYQGEVFRGLQVDGFDQDDFRFACEHLRILSGLYGVLRPLDYVLPYRLEIGGAFSPAGYDNLYVYWKTAVTRAIGQALDAQKDTLLLNLASKEYFRSIDIRSLKARVMTPVFKESRGDGFKMITVYAKKARGLMARYVIKNRITDTEGLKFFDEEGYYFNERLSHGNEMVFTR